MKALEAVANKTRTTLTVLVPVGLYASLIWLFFGSFGWQVGLALALALPIMLVPAALIWYINIGGIYSAIHHRR